MEFNVGDKVRIREYSPKIGWNSEGKMDKWIGKTMTIKEILSSGALIMEEDQYEHGGNGWIWLKEDIEKI